MQLTKRVPALALACSIALWAGASGAHAQRDTGDDRATASLRVYADDDHMTVVSPRAGVQRSLSEVLKLDVNVAADVVSGASVDVVSEASPVAIRELRVQGGLGLSARVGPLVTARGRIMASHEQDYLSLGGELGVSVELAQRNTTLDLALVGSRDRIEAVTRPELSERRRRAGATATVTQVLDRVTYIDVIAAVMRDAGYLASPYRTVPVVVPDSPLVIRAFERVPRRRWGGAGRVRIRRALSRTFFAHAWYRYYRDTWSIDSHTAALALLAAPHPRWRLGGRLRLYRQSQASFYRARYELEDGVVPELLTRERRLGRMRSAHLTVTADMGLRAIEPNAGARLMVSLGAMRFEWPDFVGQAGRNGMTLTVALNTPM